MAKQVVVDTSVIVAVAMNEADAPAILDATKGVEVFAPASLPWEVGNAISAMFKRKRIDLAEALGVLEIFNRMPIELLDIRFERALELASTLGVYAYDAYIIACAERVSSPLITLDSGLIAAAGKCGVPVLEISR
jgi:predicted nucleic acid-binding protein